MRGSPLSPGNGIPAKSGSGVRVRHTGIVRARAAVFDVYGDHLADQAYWAPISAVVTLLQTCQIAAPATRTAVSRMTAQGWLEPMTRHGVRGYAATAVGRDRLAEAWVRIYRPAAPDWDGRWHVVVTARPVDRTQRERVTATLGYLGYGRLAPQTWIAARSSPELSTALSGLQIGYSTFSTTDLKDSRELLARTWDLSELASSYQAFADDTAALGARLGTGLSPAEAYALRAGLVHRWRKFLFVDPALPEEVLPSPWPGQLARDLFLEAAGDLLGPARIFVAETLAAAGVPELTTEDPRG